MSISSVSDFPTYNKIPSILKHFCSRLDNVIKSPISYLARLNTVDKEKPRIKRIERRQAIHLIAGVLLMHMDLQTLCIMNYSRERKTEIWDSFSAYLHKLTGMNKKRIYRVLRDLEKAGYIYVSTIRKVSNKNGDIFYTTKRKIRMSINFFRDLRIKEKTIKKMQHFKMIADHNKKIKKYSKKYNFKGRINTMQSIRKILREKENRDRQEREKRRKKALEMNIEYLVNLN
jgi:DNA-binding PadR family transcriptional regulator